MSLQNSISSELIQRLTAFGPSLSRAVALAAEVDCLLSFAQCARDFRYSRPKLTNDNVLHIKQGTALMLLDPDWKCLPGFLLHGSKIVLHSPLPLFRRDPICSVIKISLVFPIALLCMDGKTAR